MPGSTKDKPVSKQAAEGVRDTLTNTIDDTSNVSEVAFTADVHLVGREEHPERYAALENILVQLEEQDVRVLVVAGDLFDATVTAPAALEALCRDHPDITIHAIPGNHDPDLSDRLVVAENLRIYTEPTMITFGVTPTLFLPYQDDVSMGDVLAEVASMLPDEGPWVLVGHGDYVSGLRQPNPYEPGIYMPLYRSDVQRFNPAMVLLGHIHKACTDGKVHHLGSPCSIDVTENGRRSYWILGTADRSLTPQTVCTGTLFFDEGFVVYPREDFIDRLTEDIHARIEAWDLEPGEHERVVVRIRAWGYSSDRATLKTLFEQGFEKFRLYDDRPDLSSVEIIHDDRLGIIAGQIEEVVNFLERQREGMEPTDEQVLSAALDIVYGGGN